MDSKDVRKLGSEDKCLLLDALHHFCIKTDKDYEFAIDCGDKEEMKIYKDKKEHIKRLIEKVQRGED